jgi:DNA polymerase-3 subunit alpha
VLFGDDYVKYNAYLQIGQAIYITGSFKQRFNKSEFEFKLASLALAENIKRQLTKQLQLEVDARHVSKDTIGFLESNIRTYPGKTSLKLVVAEPKNNLKISMVSLDSGFEMNDELIRYLEDKPEIAVVVTGA